MGRPGKAGMTPGRETPSTHQPNLPGYGPLARGSSVPLLDIVENRDTSAGFGGEHVLTGLRPGNSCRLHGPVRFGRLAAQKREEPRGTPAPAPRRREETR